MNRTDVPAELVAAAAHIVEQHLSTTCEDLARTVLAAVLPAAHDMWREQVINDLDQLTIDGPAGWGLHCGDHTIIGASGEMPAGQVVAIALGHLASPQHTGRRT